MFRKVLIANRGEIALRVTRTARQMGMRVAVVYSDIDRRACHVLAADEAYLIGPAAPSASYLNIHAVMGAAARAGAGCLHPGYGFLSENPALARACKEAGVVFVGPSPEAMERMGDKLESRRSMRKAGVPIVPGSVEPLEDAREAVRMAADIGYPVMLKASAGGGGKGMRKIQGADEMEGAFRMAASEAKRAFGDETLYLEKVVDSPRHVEIQILGDGKSAIHCGERECSVQRRHQKVVEECPSPLMTQDMRARMGEAAVRAAMAVQYEGAGTVEFLVDKERNFYFLEMNTRIQVEHPVTELVTGLDLVREQFLIASGQPLRLRQEDIAMRGWALECRLYAENPFANFAPSPGVINDLRLPQGPGIRNDVGVASGSAVPAEYDPMIGKIAAWGATRQEAIRRMAAALEECRVSGIATNLAFHKRVMENAEFLSGEYDTGFIERNRDALTAFATAHEDMAVIAAALGKYRQRAMRRVGGGAPQRAWLSEARRGGLRE